jgi:DNA-binding transcriptional LysR family regulator
VPIRQLDKDLINEHLFDEDICVAAGTRNQWANRRRKAELVDLIEEPWILPRPDTVAGALIADAFHGCGLDVPRAAVVSICLQTTTALLATGDFVATLPQSLVRFGVKPVPFKVLPIQLRATHGPVAIVTLKIEP